MKLVARRQSSAALLERGAVVDGCLVDGRARGGQSADVRYTVLTGAGERAALVMSRRAFASRQERARFRRLARLRTAFSHPAALDVLDFGEHGGHAYFVTAPLPRQTLGDLVRAEGWLPPERALTMLAPVAAALDAARARGLVHGALGTETLLLARHDRLLLDWFGLFESGEETEWWGVGTWGDLRYRPPEQLRGGALSASQNVYSLTAVAVHALTGEPPYSGEHGTLAYAHLSEPPPRVSARVPHLGGALDEVVARGLAKRPAERPRSATALLAELAGALEIELPRSTAEASHATAGVSRRPRRRRGRVALVAVLAAGAGALTAASVQPFEEDAARTPARPAAGVWKRLDSQRVDLRAQLAAADAPRDQAQIADRLASAYDDAARTAGPGAQARAARAVRDAYAALATSAEAGQESRYTQASEAIAEAERRLQARR